MKPGFRNPRDRIRPGKNPCRRTPQGDPDPGDTQDPGTTMTVSRRMPPPPTLPLVVPAPRMRASQARRSMPSCAAQRSDAFCSKPIPVPDNPPGPDILVRLAAVAQRHVLSINRLGRLVGAGVGGDSLAYTERQHGSAQEPRGYRKKSEPHGTSGRSKNGTSKVQVTHHRGLCMCVTPRSAHDRAAAFPGAPYSPGRGSNFSVAAGRRAVSRPGTRRPRAAPGARPGWPQPRRRRGRRSRQLPGHRIRATPAPAACDHLPAWRAG